MKIILDTNFLIYCAKEKLDYTEELKNIVNEGFTLVVPKQVISELERLRDDRLKKVSGKDKDACSLALQLLKSHCINVVDLPGKKVDDAIIKLSLEDKKNIVCTLDREMRHTLGRVILVNRGKKLMLTK